MTLEVLSVTFTGTVAIATVAYTFLALKLWHSARAQADIARYTAFWSLLQTLSSYADANRESNPEAARLFEAFMGLLTELGMTRLAEDIDLKKNQGAREYFRQIEGMLRANNIDPKAIPWMRIILDKIDK